MATEDYEGDLSQSTDFVNKPLDSMAHRLIHLAGIVDQFYTPMLCLFGTLGNILSIVVFVTRSSRRSHREFTSSHIYLSALALSDSFFLLSLFMMWLQNIGINVVTNAFMCPVVMYLGQVCGFLSVWFIVSFTVERFFAVCFPLSRSSRCTASRARKISTGLTLFALVAFSYVLCIAQVLPVFPNSLDESDISGMENSTAGFQHSGVVNSTEADNMPLFPNFQSVTSGEKDGDYRIWKHNSTALPSIFDQPVPVNRGDSLNGRPRTNTPSYVCTVPAKYMQISKISNYIDSILTFIIPFIIISSLNLKIIFCVKNFKGHRESLLASVKINHHGVNGRTSSPQEKAMLKNILTSSRKMREIKAHNSSRRSLWKTHGESSIMGSKATVTAPTGCYKCKEIHIKHHCGVGAGSDVTCPQGVKNERKLLDSNPSIESDSQSSTGQITPPFKRSTTNHSATATEIRVTKTLLLVSSVFLCLHTPLHLLHLLQFQNLGGSQETALYILTAMHWANFLFNLNFGLNFLLYCCSGKAFRHSVKNLFTSDRGTPSPARSNATTITTQLTWTNPDSIVTTRAQRNIKQIQENQV